MNSDDIKSPEWHGKALRRTEKALGEGTDRFIDWEEAKRIIWEQTSARDGIEIGLSDVEADRTIPSDAFFEEFFSRCNIPHTE